MKNYERVPFRLEYREGLGYYVYTNNVAIASYFKHYEQETLLFDRVIECYVLSVNGMEYEVPIVAIPQNMIREVIVDGSTNYYCYSRDIAHNLAISLPYIENISFVDDKYCIDTYVLNEMDGCKILPCRDNSIVLFCGTYDCECEVSAYGQKEIVSMPICGVMKKDISGLILNDDNQGRVLVEFA